MHPQSPPLTIGGTVLKESDELWCHLMLRIAVIESLNRNLNRVCVWCGLWGMKLNADKTKTMIVSRSRTVHPQLTTLTLDGTAEGIY